MGCIISNQFLYVKFSLVRLIRIAFVLGLLAHKNCVQYNIKNCNAHNVCQLAESEARTYRVLSYSLKIKNKTKNKSYLYMCAFFDVETMS